MQDEERYEEVPQEADWRSRAQQRPPRRQREEALPLFPPSEALSVSLLSLSFSVSFWQMRLYGDGIFNHEQKMALLDQKIAMLKGLGSRLP